MGREPHRVPHKETTWQKVKLEIKRLSKQNEALSPLPHSFLQELYCKLSIKCVFLCTAMPAFQDTSWDIHIWIWYIWYRYTYAYISQLHLLYREGELQVGFTCGEAFSSSTPILKCRLATAPHKANSGLDSDPPPFSPESNSPASAPLSPLARKEGRGKTYSLPWLISHKTYKYLAGMGSLPLFILSRLVSQVKYDRGRAGVSTGWVGLTLSF